MPTVQRAEKEPTTTDTLLNTPGLLICPTPRCNPGIRAETRSEEILCKSCMAAILDYGESLKEKLC